MMLHYQRNDSIPLRDLFHDQCLVMITARAARHTKQLVA